MGNERRLIFLQLVVMQQEHIFNTTYTTKLHGLRDKISTQNQDTK